jgi:phospholipid/cholesterol/gamma-HCH transport system substrate-binding protein
VTLARGAATAALGLALVIVAVVLLGGGGTTSYKLHFQNAGQLVKDDDVQVGGRRVGSIKEIKLTDDNQAEVRIEVQDDFAPLHVGTTAVIRATSLSGIANRYVALTPGRNDAKELPDGATLTAERTTPIVDLDQLFNTLDPKARRSLQKVIDGSFAQYEGQGEAANRATQYFAPALSTSSRLVNEVVRDQRAFTDFLVQTSKVSTALASRRGDLASLVSNTNATAEAIAAEDAPLNEALGRLPGTLRRANTTFVNLRSTLDDLDGLVSASKPATKRLAPFLRELRPLVSAARPTIKDLRLLIRRPGSGNDLVELVRKTPRLERAARAALPNAGAALRQVTPVVSFIRPYTPDFLGWVRDFGVSTANYDANGHFARIQPIFNAFSLANDPGLGATLRALPADQRIPGLDAGGFKRCPGMASQPAADGSTPYIPDGLDCDRSVELPGP